MATASTLLPHGARPKAGVRRLSSMTATREDLVTGPTVVVPPKHMMAPSNAHEVAEAMEMAKHHIDQVASGEISPAAPQPTTTTDAFAYAFDIDGVLIRGGKPIPEAVEAMKVLNGQNEWGIKVYVILCEYRRWRLID